MAIIKIALPNPAWITEVSNIRVLAEGFFQGTEPSPEMYAWAYDIIHKGDEIQVDDSLEEVEASDDDDDSGTEAIVMEKHFLTETYHSDIRYFDPNPWIPPEGASAGPSYCMTVVEYEVRSDQTQLQRTSVEWFRRYAVVPSGDTYLLTDTGDTIERI